MIAINLLPKELRVKEVKAVGLADMPIIPVGIGVLALLVVMHLVIVITTAMSRGTYDTLKKRWEGYAPDKARLDSLNSRIKDLDAKVMTIEELTRNRILWAGLLDGLSSATLDNVWYAGLSFKEKSGSPALYLDGYAAGPSEEATASIGRLINSLEADKNLKESIERVELGSIQESTIEKQQCMRFGLTCVFRKRP